MKTGTLVILDGVGIRKQKNGNAFKLAKTPFFDFLDKEYPEAILKADGNAVGLPEGFMGNSEVGHITIGAGRILWESMERINRSIQNSSFFRNPAFLEAAANCKKNGSAMHLMGLVSDQGVHSHISHLFALLDFCQKQKIKKVWIHFFSDGRDTRPKQALEYLRALEKKIRAKKNFRIATVSGRYYAMDRDKRWKRVKKAFDCIANGKGLAAATARKAIAEAYSRGESDEFIQPTALDGFGGIQPHDSAVFFNFRLDRGRELTRALTEKKFSGFKRKKILLFFVAMCPYYQPMNAAVAFGEPHLKNVLAEVLSKNGLKQLRVAETEKFAHATYFFNGQNQEPFPGEKRILIPSPKVATYEKTPAMRAREITQAVVRALAGQKFGAIICNFANGDMVGHTGNLKATIKSVEILNSCVHRIVSMALQQKGFVIVTADHGNCESVGLGNRIHKSHTTNKVPCWVISQPKKPVRKKGTLADIAPTFLSLLKLPKPREMTGQNLVRKK